MRLPRFIPPILIVSGVVALGLGGGTAWLLDRQGLMPLERLPFVGGQFAGTQQLSDSNVADSDDTQALLAMSLPELQTLANQGQGIDRYRARYLLATKLQGDQPQQALGWLKTLDQDYPLLAPAVLSLRANLQDQVGQPQEAQVTWTTLLRNYPQSPLSAEALYGLGKTDVSYEEQLLSQWPAHPLSVEVALQRLDNNPDDLPRLLQVARYGYYTFNFLEVLDRLRQNHGDQLSPDDWEALGFGYWEKQDYQGAAEAYAKSTATALTLYRAGRSYQNIGEGAKARSFYERLVREFPQDPDTAWGLKRLATLVEQSDRRQALDLWQQLYERFPQEQPLALLEKSNLLKDLGSQKSAQEAQKSILSQHSTSETAAELRWQFAQEAVNQSDWNQATRWVEGLQRENPDSAIVAQASFEAGQWWQQLGNSRKAQAQFAWVLRYQPDSYYAWRSALQLGLAVGDFTTLWRTHPPVPALQDPNPIPAGTALNLPSGSPLLKELHRLGQGRSAWRLWQVEFTQRQTPSVHDQFTDGLIRFGVGDYLDGLFMLNSLAWRDDPQEQATYAALREQPGYGQTLYPLLFRESIYTWSQDRDLNPLLVIALMRQESRFMPGIVSGAGAVGLMQVMPDTAAWIAGQTDIGDYALNDPDDSVKLGTWYLNYTHEEWQGNSLLAVASYNAGPGNVADWVQRFGFSQPDRFVEQIPFPETRNYVESVFANYWNYLRLYDPDVIAALAPYQP